MAEIKTSDITEGKVGGDGIFDEFMTSITARLEKEYDLNRIKGPEYAKVYLGTMESALSQAIAYALQRQASDKQAELLVKQAELLVEQIKNESLNNSVIVSNIEKNNADIELIRAKILTEASQRKLVDAQIIKMEREYPLIDAEIVKTHWDGVIAEAQSQKAEAEVLLISKQVIKMDDEIQLMRAQVTEMEGRAIVVQKSAIKMDSEIDLMKSQAEKMAQEVLLIEKQVIKMDDEISLMRAQVVKMEGEGILTQKQVIRMDSEILLMEGQVQEITQKIESMRAAVWAERAKTADDVTSDQPPTPVTGIIGKQKDKMNAEIGLLSQKQLSEEAQTEELIGTDNHVVTGVVGKQKALMTRQADGFLRDAEQKASKFFTDAFTVQRSTDEGFSPLGTGLENDEINKVLNRLKAGIGVPPNTIGTGSFNLDIFPTPGTTLETGRDFTFQSDITDGAGAPAGGSFKYRYWRITMPDGKIINKDLDVDVDTVPYQVVISAADNTAEGLLTIEVVCVGPASNRIFVSTEQSFNISAP